MIWERVIVMDESVQTKVNCSTNFQGSQAAKISVTFGLKINVMYFCLK